MFDSFGSSEFIGGLFGNISVLNLILIQRKVFLDSTVSMYLPI